MIIVIEIKVHFLSNFDYHIIPYNICSKHVKKMPNFSPRSVGFGHCMYAGSVTWYLII